MSPNDMKCFGRQNYFYLARTQQSLVLRILTADYTIFLPCNKISISEPVENREFKKQFFGKLYVLNNDYGLIDIDTIHVSFSINNRTLYIEIDFAAICVRVLCDRLCGFVLNT